MVQYNAGDCVVASSFVCDVTAHGQPAVQTTGGKARFHNRRTTTPATRFGMAVQYKKVGRTEATARGVDLRQTGTCFWTVLGRGTVDARMDGLPQSASAAGAL